MNKKIMYVVLLSIALLLIAGCNPNANSQRTTPQQKGAQANEYNGTTPERKTRVLVGSDLNPNLVTGRNDVRDIQAEADSMANVAVQVPKVKRASVVINGAQAYVGLTLTDTVRSRQEATAIREKVRQRVQEKMPRYHVRVSSDTGIFSRIQDIGDGIRSGTPINNYRIHMNELNNRMNR
ncbi:YhcN/YlaJ family sporulation lipoprotein [Aneurinibacillus aneurinilyticus]|jgi:YhcN/YlaJ family sporulation lipoprotein|uniref:YhcN/YlaJ family sporulation lipoprotein n=1 Tax=Aneurinibacillus aneurinilyticus TaxID=1391 RepID=UPI0023F7026F|nr:YhcN/YlaJ family sporulation lipoprotein [Aneurinibacillus aneurinilyticus]MCI1695950.1 YhcN/YlaJ family sporulation lipoprotein [Aneurinibacillus aneurinilyticus]MED0671938.1 YhcN/YlaJ family sporulation lipoprotein [Aneurinibacillus aneurinilyticus]